jgi:hypothetical protein
MGSRRPGEVRRGGEDASRDAGIYSARGNGLRVRFGTDEVGGARLAGQRAIRG